MLEYCAKSELDPRSGFGVLKGRKMFGMEVSFFISVDLRKTDLPPLRGGRFLNRYLGLKPQAESCCPFGAETERAARFFKLLLNSRNTGLASSVVSLSIFVIDKRYPSNLSEE